MGEDCFIRYWNSSKPATSALELVQNGQTTNGVYYIKAEDSPTQQIYCILDPAYDGGGWMVLANNAAIGIIRNRHIFQDLLHTLIM